MLGKDIIYLFSRFSKSLTSVAGDTVFYRVCKRKEAVPVGDEYYIEAFTLNGFIRFDGELYAVVIYKDTPDVTRIGKVGYIHESDILSNTYQTHAAALIVMQHMAEERIVC